MNNFYKFFSNWRDFGEVLPHIMFIFCAFFIGLTGYLVFEDIIFVIPLITNIICGLIFFDIIKKSAK